MSLDICKTPTKKLQTIAVSCTANLITPARRLFKVPFHISFRCTTQSRSIKLSCRTTSPPDGNLSG